MRCDSWLACLSVVLLGDLLSGPLLVQAGCRPLRALALAPPARTVARLDEPSPTRTFRGTTSSSPRRSGRITTPRTGSSIRWKVEESDQLERIGARHAKRPEQIALRWLIQQRGVNAIPKTSDEDHCRENFDLFDFVLSESEMKEIAGLSRPDGRLISPEDLAPD